MPLTPTVTVSPFDLDANLLPDQSDVVVTGLLGGGFVAAWTDDSGEVGTGTGADIVIRLYDADGTLGTIRQGNTLYTNGGQFAPALAAAADGGFFLGYVDDSDAGDTVLRVQKHDSAGNISVVGTVQLDFGTPELSDLSLAVDPFTGDVVAAWKQVEGAETTTRYSRFDAALNRLTGDPVGGTVVRADDAPTVAGDELDAPEIAVTTGGELRWVLLETDGTDVGVEVVEAAGDGSGLTKVEIHTTSSDNNPALSPAITPLLGGGYAAAWIRVSVGVGNFGSHVEGPAGSGVSQSSTWTLPGHDLLAVDVVGLPDGGAYFVIHDGTADALIGFRRDANGDYVGEPFHPLFDVDPSLSSFELSVDGDGMLSVVWTDDFGVHGGLLDPRTTDPDSVHASELGVVAAFSGADVFTIYNDVDAGTRQDLHLGQLALSGYDAIALAPDPYDPAAVNMHFVYWQFAAGALDGPLVFDMTASGASEFAVVVDMLGGGDLDMTDWSVFGGGEVLVEVTDVGVGSNIVGGALDTTYEGIGADSFIDSSTGSDLFLLDAGTSDYGTLFIDGDNVGDDTLMLIAGAGDPTVRDFTGATILNMETLVVLGATAQRLIIDVETIEIDDVFTDADVDHVFELHAETVGELNLSEGGAPLANASGSIEIHGGDIDQVFTFDNDHDTTVFAGGGDDRIRINEPGGGALLLAAIVAEADALTHVIEGGEGYDIVSLDRARAEFSVARTASGFTLTATDMVLELEGVEAVEFVDQDLFLDPDGPGAMLLTEFSPLIYDSGQDHGTTTVTEDAAGGSLHLSGNDWAALEVQKTVTANTVVRFALETTDEGEVIGFGFDYDLTFSPGTFFTLGGVDGVLTNGDFDGRLVEGDGITWYEIPIGAYYTGDFAYMYFTGDDDGDQTASTTFSGIEFFERTTLDVAGESLRVISHGDDDTGAADVSADHRTISLTDGAKKAVALDTTVTADTWLTFAFEGGSATDVHAIGFDTDAELTLADAAHLFQVDGPAQAGVTQDWNTYYDGAGVRHYAIRVGDYFTGDFSYLTFLNLGGSEEISFTDIDVFDAPAMLFMDELMPVRSYTPEDNGDATLSGDLMTLTLSGDAWKVLPVNGEVDPTTWIAFDFAADAGMDWVGIGMDADGEPGGETWLKLAGDEAMGVTPDFWSYDIGGGLSRVFVQVGDYFSGDIADLIFVADDDDGTPGTATFGNFTAYDDMLMVNGAPTEIVSYAGYQDAGEAETLPGGDGFTLLGNAWKAMRVDASIGTGTYLVFDLEASDLGEITAIGFDDDLNGNWGTLFQLGGPDSYGLQDYRSYAVGDGKVRFEINVGAHYQGDFAYLVAMSDDDADGSSNVTFSNISLEQAPLLEVSGTGYEVVSYGGSQDHGAATVADGTRIELMSNAWKAVEVGATITEDTWVSFDFYSDLPVEMAGFGFDADLSPTVAGFFQIAGSETYGNQAYRTYSVGDGWVHYDVHVGAAMAAGFYDYLSLVADDDSAPVGRAFFDNIEIYEVEVPALDVNGTVEEVISYGGAQDAGEAVTSEDGLSMTLSGNAWKAVNRPVSIDSDTWLAVTFEAQVEGEVFAIGFDNDLSPSVGSVWQLSGTDIYGQQAENDVAVGDGPVRKYINVGATLSGTYDNIVFIADDDFGGEGVATFSDLEILQGPAALYEGYGGAATGLVQELDGGAGVRLSDNANRTLAATVDVDANTILHFEFKSYEEGEIHGIGLDVDSGISTSFWQLMGTQVVGKQTHNGIYSAGDGWMAFDIAVGAEIAHGVYDRVSLLMDSDGAGAPGDSYFRNVWFENVGAADEDVMIL